MLCAINRHDRRFSQQQMEFLAILGAFAATAIENARLAEEARYVLLASERNRIAGELHDGISQSLFSISLGLELAKKQVFKDPLGVSGRMAELQEQLNTAMVELRRVIYDLRPMKLQEMGLAGSIDLWIREVTSGRDITGKLEVLGHERALTASAEACLYRVAKEAVSNVIRHASASLLNVSLRFSDISVCLTVSDDGQGFSPEALTGDAQQGTGLGLRSMQQRVETEGGRLTVKSAPQAGTVIRAELPLGGVE
jgi:signal transduction histidine kinase